MKMREPRQCQAPRRSHAWSCYLASSRRPMSYLVVPLFDDPLVRQYMVKITDGAPYASTIPFSQHHSGLLVIRKSWSRWRYQAVLISKGYLKRPKGPVWCNAPFCHYIYRSLFGTCHDILRDHSSRLLNSTSLWSKMQT